MNQHNSDGSNPGYTHTLLDAVPNWWDRRGVVGKAITVFALVLVCMFTAGLLVGFTS